MTAHALYDIWEDEDASLPWCAQLVNYVGHFATREMAENFIALVQAYRKKHGFK
jgi:hypothetical protein